MAAAGGLLARPVPAGFPSPADDYLESRISLDDYLICHREATFFLRVEGDSMQGVGIFDGDLLVVDRALVPVDGSIVIAVIDGAFTVKQFYRKTGGGALLKAANPAYADMEISPDRELILWGIVRWAIHRV